MLVGSGMLLEGDGLDGSVAWIDDEDRAWVFDECVFFRSSTARVWHLVVALQMFFTTYLYLEYE